MQHIVPLNDEQPHTEDTTCICQPKVEIFEGHLIVIHRSFDRRECLEGMPIENCPNNDNKQAYPQIKTPFPNSDKYAVYQCDNCDCEGFETDETRALFQCLNNI